MTIMTTKITNNTSGDNKSVVKAAGHIKIGYDSHDKSSPKEIRLSAMIKMVRVKTFLSTLYQENAQMLKT